MEFTLDDTYFMKKALQEAEAAYEKGEIPVGAVIVVNDRIIARAHNLTEQLGDVTAHAEMHRVILDGLMDDWIGLDPIYSDPLGDGGSSGIDIGGIWIAHGQMAES